MPPAAELIARTLALQQTTPEILTASAQISRQILGTDSTFMAVADGTGAYPMSITTESEIPSSGRSPCGPQLGWAGRCCCAGARIG